MGSCEAASEAASQKLDLLVIPITIMINWEELVNAQKSRRGEKKHVKTSFKKIYCLTKEKQSTETAT